MAVDVGAGDPLLQTYLRAIWRRKWVVAVVVAVVTGAAVAGSLLQTPRYTATAQIRIQPSNTPVPLSPNSASQSTLGSADVLTEQSLVTSNSVKDIVRSQLGQAPKVSATAVDQTNLIAVSATSTDPRWAARVANAYANAYVNSRRNQAANDLSAAAAQIQAKITDLDQQIAAAKPSPEAVTALSTQEASFRAELAQLQVNSALSSGGAEVASPAAVPGSPSSPRTVLNGVVALALGLILGIGLALLFDYLDDSIRSKEDLDRLSPDLPVIGTVPLVAAWKDSNEAWLVSTSAPSSAPAEAYRTLRTSLKFLSLEKSIRTVLVTSPSEDEGKTTTLANLAVSLAQAGQRVAVASCDLRRPRLHAFFGLPNGSGFTSVLLGEAQLGHALQRVARIENLAVLPSGPVPPNPAELLASEGAVEVFAKLKDRFDIVLIDSPPVLPVADSVILSERADATLLVVAAGQTRSKELTRSIETLRQVKASITGLILNEVTKQTGYEYSYGYSYRSSHSWDGVADGSPLAKSDGTSAPTRRSLSRWPQS
jgi:capsular exopolysaccharide synthesis family protein